MQLFGALNVVLASASNAGEDFVYKNMYPVAKYVYQQFQPESYNIAGFILLAVIYALCIVVYNLGFAKKLLLWQNVIIYIFLFIGCVLLTFFAFFLPVIEGLLIIAVVLILYKIGRRREPDTQTTE